MSSLGKPINHRPLSEAGGREHFSYIFFFQSPSCDSPSPARVSLNHWQGCAVMGVRHVHPSTAKQSLHTVSFFNFAWKLLPNILLSHA